MKINKAKYIINAINRLIDLKVINLTIVHIPVCQQVVKQNQYVIFVLL